MCLKHLSCFLEQPSEEAKGDKAFLPAEQYSICMLHRSPIQVFYASKKDADADKYADIGEVICRSQASSQPSPPHVCVYVLSRLTRRLGRSTPSEGSAAMRRSCGEMLCPAASAA